VTRTPDKIRKQNSRRRRRLGLRVIQVEVAMGEIEFLRRRGYEVADDEPIGNTVSAFLGDSAFEVNRGVAARPTTPRRTGSRSCPRECAGAGSVVLAGRLCSCVATRH
jgi:hypothetical protein